MSKLKLSYESRLFKGSKIHTWTVKSPQWLKGDEWSHFASAHTKEKAYELSLRHFESIIAKKEIDELLKGATVLFDGEEMPLENALDKLWKLQMLGPVSYSINSNEEPMKIEILES